MRVAILISIVAVTACTATSKEPNWSQPRLIPPGWTHDYEYNTNLVVYLRGQYKSARQANATAYVYFYSDTDRHCLGTRRMMSRSEVAPLLENIRVSMLDADRLKRLHKQSDGNAFDPGDWVPVMAKVAANGTLVTPLYLPDVPLYHTDPRKIHRQSLVTGRAARDRERQFVKELDRFLQTNNEI